MPLFLDVARAASSTTARARRTLVSVGSRVESGLTALARRARGAAWVVSTEGDVDVQGEPLLASDPAVQTLARASFQRLAAAAAPGSTRRHMPATDERLVVLGLEEPRALFTARIDSRRALGLLAHPDAPIEPLRDEVDVAVREIEHAPVEAPTWGGPRGSGPSGGGASGAPAELGLGPRRPRS